ncbi:MAG: histidine--tRNA ligase [Candidatus Aenigmatarchaeota archaeon]
MQTVKGTRDLMPEDMRVKNFVIDTIKDVFELYGFQPLDTPALESWEVLSKKGAGGEGIVKEAYKFEDKAGRMIGLRYDLTVPLARVIASNPKMILPFKRYQTGKIWRYDDVSKGRFREFTQMDIDIVGSDSLMADAENISCAIDCFKALGFEKFYVRLSSRKILADLAKYAGIKDKVPDVFRIIDKLEKAGEKEVIKQLEEIIPKAAIKKILDFIKITGANEEMLKKAAKVIKSQGLDDVKEILSFVNDSSKVKVDLSLARGLDYYTGPIFEVSADKEIGTVAAGGRYDNLVGLFLKEDIPATGISFGIDRIIEIIKKDVSASVKAFVIAVNDKVRKDVLDIAKELRSKGVSADYDFRSRRLSKQLEYASSMGIPFAVIVGPKELVKKSVTLRNMKTGKEEMIEIKSLAKKF